MTVFVKKSTKRIKHVMAFLSSFTLVLFGLGGEAGKTVTGKIVDLTSDIAYADHGSGDGDGQGEDSGGSDGADGGGDGGDGCP